MFDIRTVTYNCALCVLLIILIACRQICHIFLHICFGAMRCTACHSYYDICNISRQFETVSLRLVSGTPLVVRQWYLYTDEVLLPLVPFVSLWSTYLYRGPAMSRNHGRKKAKLNLFLSDGVDVATVFKKLVYDRFLLTMLQTTRPLLVLLFFTISLWVLWCLSCAQHRYKHLRFAIMMFLNNNWLLKSSVITRMLPRNTFFYLLN